MGANPKPGAEDQRRDLDEAVAPEFLHEALLGTSDASICCTIMGAAAEPHPKLRRWKGAPRRMFGFTLAETVIAMALCTTACAGFYLAIGLGMRIVRNARDQAQASLLLEQRIEALRARTFWQSIVTTSGIRAMLQQPAPTAAGLNSASETLSVGPYPGKTTSFSVTRRADGTFDLSGASLPPSQKTVRVTGTVSWGAAGQSRRHTRHVSTIFTKGGL
jgi:type II secretory pathway pseudopilin PulG